MVTPELYKRAENFDRRNSRFRTNALKLIKEMDDRNCSPELFEEFLHSIFFLGHIIYLESKVILKWFTPEEILPEKLFNKLKTKFQKPFDRYKTELPRRTPFSSVVEQVVSECDPQDEMLIVKKLCELIKKLNLKGRYRLYSSTICVSKYQSARYYGASMSTTGGNEGQIMIAISCLQTWHTLVSDAVMSYFPGKKESDTHQDQRNESKRKDFDGTMTLPDSVKCEAFRLPTGKIIPPCGLCRNLFGLKTTVDTIWPYGNCAEAESLSTLLEEELNKMNVPPSCKLKMNECVKRETQLCGLETTVNKIWPYGNCAECESLSTLMKREQIEVEVPPSCTPEMSERVKRETRKWLVGRLQELDFNLLCYYNPSKG